MSLWPRCDPLQPCSADHSLSLHICVLDVHIYMYMYMYVYVHFRFVDIPVQHPWYLYTYTSLVCKQQFFTAQCGGCGISNGLFLLDTTRVSQLSLSTGKTRRNFPSLSRVQSVLALTHVSRSGSVLAGLTVHGHMFTWLQPYHQLATYTTPLSTPSPHADSLKGNEKLYGTYYMYMQPTEKVEVGDDEKVSIHSKRLRREDFWMRELKLYDHTALTTTCVV